MAIAWAIYSRAMRLTDCRNVDFNRRAKQRPHRAIAASDDRGQCIELPAEHGLAGELDISRPGRQGHHALPSARAENDGMEIVIEGWISIKTWSL